MADHVCPWWLAYTFDNALRKLVHNPRRMLSEHVHAGMTVMDVGCGLGYFSLGMAKLVGSQGKVYSVDIQRQMLARVEKRAKRAGLDAVIQTIQCTALRFETPKPLDFVLAFWMVHETPEPKYFLQQIRSAIKAEGKLLVTEPKFHVGRSQFELEVQMAEGVGLRLIDRPVVAMSHAALFSLI